MILVTGSTGNAGSAVVRALLGAGAEVRAMVRSDDRRAALPDGAEGAVGDLNTPESLPLDGVSAVFLLSGYEGLPDALRRMHDAGVERVVLLSSSAAPLDLPDNAVAAYHRASEEAVRSSGLPWTLLRPNSFMTNTLEWAPQLRAGDAVEGPWPQIRVATIDPDDVGAVAAAALTSTGHEGRAYRLSGPESLLPAERLVILGKVLGRELSFEGWPDERSREELGEQMPAEYVDAFYEFFAEGALDESEVLPTVQEVTGCEPRSFELWAAAHSADFGAGP